MQIKTTRARYGSLSIGLHWLMLLLLVAVYACIELGEFFPEESGSRSALKAWHYTLGLSVFALVWLRLLVSLVTTAPEITPEPPRWQTLASRAVQGALYVFMILMPLAGWLALSAEGQAIAFFGLQLPALVAANENFSEIIGEVHETGAVVGYLLIALHAAAALFHHYAVRDNTLKRMLPGRR